MYGATSLRSALPRTTVSQTSPSSIQTRRCFHAALSRRLPPCGPWAVRTNPTTVTISTTTPTIPNTSGLIATAAAAIAPPPTARTLHSSARPHAPAAPKSRDRGPASEETTQTDFAALDVLAHTTAPSTAVEACTADGFALNSGLRVGGGGGVMLVGGEAFAWRPWAAAGEGGGRGTLRNRQGQFEVPRDAWGLLDLVWPKPDLLILGTGPGVLPVSAATRGHLLALGVRVEVQDTRNAAAQFNLLATERGVSQVVAALVPMGWREGR